MVRTRTLIVGGARVVREGRTIDRRDMRFKAGIVISAPPFYGERDLHAVLAAITIPTFHVTATADVIALPGRRSPVQDRLEVYEAVGRQGRRCGWSSRAGRTASSPTGC